MIAFDFDGVFFPDFKYHSIEDFGNNLNLYKNLLPYWVPDFDYYIVTDRPKQFEKQTREFIDLYMYKNPPIKLFHDNVSNKMGDGDYKIDTILNNSEISIFIESEKEQYYKIKQKLSHLNKTDVDVFHFEKMILLTNNAFNKLYNN